jgi:hypothetical protein
MMFRCTRLDVYEPGCPGHENSSARQGYYIEASCRESAEKRMHEMFPEDINFDIQEWKKGKASKFRVEICRVSHAFTTIEVEAMSCEEAVQHALEVAGDLSYSEKAAEYSVEYVTTEGGFL